MPIKADVNLNNDDAISYSGSLINLNNPNSSTNINASTTNLTSQSSSSSHPQTGNQSLKSQSVANDKFSRFDGGEQQIVVSLFLFFFKKFRFKMKRKTFKQINQRRERKKVKREE